MEKVFLRNYQKNIIKTKIIKKNISHPCADPCRNACECIDSCQDENSYFCRPPDDSPRGVRNVTTTISIIINCLNNFFKFLIFVSRFRDLKNANGE